MEIFANTLMVHSLHTYLLTFKSGHISTNFLSVSVPPTSYTVRRQFTSVLSVDEWMSIFFEAPLTSCT
jgi:hypothetical protein